MTDGAADVLRRAAAHAIVADVEAPQLDDASAHHVFTVLRVGDGATVTVTDGAGRWRACRAAGRVLEPVTEARSVSRRRSPVTIGLAIPKSDRPEWVIQKLTELGVDRIVLLDAARSVVRWDSERSMRHVAKLRRVAAEAVQQSRRVWLPEIAGPVPAAQLLPDAAVAEPGGGPLDPRRHRDVLIGPEGGWSDHELALAGEQVSLGASVLRVETAALAAAVLLVAADRHADTEPIQR